MHLFAGAGGGLLADLILGHEPICAVEWDAYCCQVLRERSADGWFPDLHVYEGDIRLFDPSEYAGRVDCIHAGFPCQDISVAGAGAGIDGGRSGLWSEVVRVAAIVRPRFLFLENSPAITNRGLEVVLHDLSALGFDAEWLVLPASAAGAPHVRARWWCLATRQAPAWEPCECCDEFKCNIHGAHVFECECPPIDEWDTDPYSDARLQRLQERTGIQPRGEKTDPAATPSMWWSVEPDLDRVADGVAARVDRIKGIGNGQVPLQAAVAWRLLAL